MTLASQLLIPYLNITTAEFIVLPFLTFLMLTKYIRCLYTHTHIHHSYTCMLFLKTVLNPLSSTHQWALKTLEPFVFWLAAS